MNTGSNALDGLYHQTFGLPAGILASVCRRFALEPSPHARRALVDDRFLSEAVQDGRTSLHCHFNAPDLLPQAVQVNVPQIIEVEIVDGQPAKLLVRLPATPHFDLVLALVPRGLRATIKTLWLNRKSDAHETLDAARYRKP